MTDREKELQNSLDGLEASMPKPFWKLAEILELQVLEISRLSKEEADCLIPYMMNDAVENYLILKDCKMTGEYVERKRSDSSGSSCEDGNIYISCSTRRRNAFYTTIF